MLKHIQLINTLSAIVFPNFELALRRYNTLSLYKTPLSAQNPTARTRNNKQATTMQEKQEAASEVVLEEQEDDDGPPPGFACVIISPQKAVAEAILGTEIDVDDDDDGPPPGFGSIAPNPLPTAVSSAVEVNSKEEEVEDDDEDGPPPGWEFSNLTNALPKLQSEVTDTKTDDSKGELDEDEDCGPPPGWENVPLPHKPTPPSTAPSSTVSSNGEMETKENVVRSNDGVSPPVSETIPVPEHSATPPPQSLQKFVLESRCDAVKKEEAKDNNDEMEKSPSILKQASPQQLPSQAQDSASSEKAQLVCGTCRKLCLYPLGAKWVQCPECKEVNFVLEAHELGTVKCGGCATLLMYPHGAPAVQCTSCHFVTEIGAHNERPPLSAQQTQRRRVRIRRPNRAH